MTPPKNRIDSPISLQDKSKEMVYCEFVNSIIKRIAIDHGEKDVSCFPLSKYEFADGFIHCLYVEAFEIGYRHVLWLSPQFFEDFSGVRPPDWIEAYNFDKSSNILTTFIGPLVDAFVKQYLVLPL